MRAPMLTVRVAQVLDDRFEVDLGGYCIDAPSVSPAIAAHVAVFDLDGVRLQ